MKVSVYDTYVQKKGSLIMHFDIIVEENTSLKEVLKYGTTYLSSKGLPNLQLTTTECQFCHIEHASEVMVSAIENQNFYILEMENCN